jgi:hypothetical protein
MVANRVRERSSMVLDVRSRPATGYKTMVRYKPSSIALPFAAPWYAIDNGPGLAIGNRTRLRGFRIDRGVILVTVQSIGVQFAQTDISFPFRGLVSAPQYIYCSEVNARESESGDDYCD